MSQPCLLGRARTGRCALGNALRWRFGGFVSETCNVNTYDRACLWSEHVFSSTVCRNCRGIVSQRSTLVMVLFVDPPDGSFQRHGLQGGGVTICKKNVLFPQVNGRRMTIVSKCWNNRNKVQMSFSKHAILN